MSDPTLYLQELCNRYGDFKVCTNLKRGGWSKHKSVLWVWERLDKEGWRLKKAHHMQILPCWIIIDIDPKKGENDTSVRGRVKRICYDLHFRLQANFICYHTGGRGYHIHIKRKDLARLSRCKRRVVREKYISFYGGELQKASDNVMISIPGVKHRSSGVKKEVCKWWQMT